VDGVDVAGMDLMLRTTQKLQAYAPLLVHRNPRDVVQIGYGSGETCGIGLDFGVANYSIVDICPGVFKAGSFFRDINRGSFENPRLRKIIMDGKNFIKLTDEKFDVIMNDSTYPGTTGSSALYTYDHFRACRDRLKPGGVLSCWVPLDLRLQDFRLIVRSFQRAMPNCSLWMANNCLNKHAVLLGTLEPMQLDLRRIGEIMSRSVIAEDLQRISIHSAYDFVDCCVIGEQGLRRLAGDGPLHTDDRPRLEFGATIKRDTDACWLDMLYAIGEHHTPVLPYVTNAAGMAGQTQEPQVILQQYYQGTKYTLLGLVGMLEGNAQVMNRAFEMAHQANPQDRDIESIFKEMHEETLACEAAVGRTPDAPDLRERLGKRLPLLEQYVRAAQQYQRFVELKPASASGWNNLGVCFRHLDQLDKAAQAFEQALRHNPRLTAAYMNLAWLRQKQGNPAEATRALERSLSFLQGMERAQVHEQLADLHVAQQHYDLALRCLDTAVESARDHPQLRQELAEKRQRTLEEARAKGWQP
jgi:spermidine synthase